MAFWILFAVSFVCWILKHTTLTAHPNAPPNTDRQEIMTTFEIHSEDTVSAALACCENRNLN